MLVNLVYCHHHGCDLVRRLMYAAAAPFCRTIFRAQVTMLRTLGVRAVSTIFTATNTWHAHPNHS